jgi:glycosyl transferase family 11
MIYYQNTHAEPCAALKIVLREFGGLGNQFFRYAALRYYAKRYGAEMAISVDPEWNAQSFGYPRPCLLQHYSIPAPMEERSLSERILFTEKQWLRAACGPFTRALRNQVFVQQPSHRYYFSPDVPLRRNTETLYLLGYWHTHTIVDKVADELRPELTLKKPAQGKNLEVLERIRRSHSVSLHLRRGDCKNPATLRTELPFEYYATAISTLKERLGNPTFFVFSDDIPFAKEYLPQDIKAVFVDHNDDFSAHEDMRLMSSCDHHIIANSTFSWWGAWLNPSLDKIVIAPKQWDLTEDSYYPDLLPPDWMLMEVASPRLFGRYSFPHARPEYSASESPSLWSVVEI